RARRADRCERSASRRAGSLDPHRADRLGHGLELVLVPLLAPEEVEGPPAARDGVTHELGQEYHAGRERGARGVEAGVVEPDPVVPLDRDEGGDGARGGVEEPEAARLTLSEGGQDAAEELLHALVHEARLPRAGSPVQVEELTDPPLDLGWRA